MSDVRADGNKNVRRPAPSARGAGISPTLICRSGLAVLLGGIALAGCATPSTPEPVAVPASRAAAPAEEPLASGDVIEIRVFQEPDLTGSYTIGTSGAVDVPLIGRVEMVGKSAETVSEEIRSRLAQGYLSDPHVTVKITDRNAQKIYILGQVQKTGTMAYTSRMTIIEAIASAGGFTRMAATNRVKVTRTVNSEEHTYEVAAGEIGSGKAPNFELQPGDIVYVPETIF